ncbi:hypothetical protein JRO89_XS13G0113900 [Xanthoceras sorbifolium]|uniref:Uncharacterized protein n=1 Tax=Xanthoceras sorbifolium TaxID=99658 RepID=A0ABQ8H7U4_9ROSI|nr:hypothetical protein JRO89_XS13G0113900 [Xanthoceras sorbifolium]
MVVASWELAEDALASVAGRMMVGDTYRWAAMAGGAFGLVVDMFLWVGDTFSWVVVDMFLWVVGGGYVFVGGGGYFGVGGGYVFVGGGGYFGVGGGYVFVGGGGYVFVGGGGYFGVGGGYVFVGGGGYFGVGGGYVFVGGGGYVFVGGGWYSGVGGGYVFVGGGGYSGVGGGYVFVGGGGYFGVGGGYVFVGGGCSGCGGNAIPLRIKAFKLRPTYGRKENATAIAGHRKHVPMGPVSTCGQANRNTAKLNTLQKKKLGYTTYSAIPATKYQQLIDYHVKQSMRRKLEENKKCWLQQAPCESLQRRETSEKDREITYDWSHTSMRLEIVGEQALASDRAGACAGAKIVKEEVV